MAASLLTSPQYPNNRNRGYFWNDSGKGSGWGWVGRKDVIAEFARNPETVSSLTGNPATTRG